MSEDIAFVNGDGTMAENWTSNIGSEFQGNESLSGVQSLNDLVGGFIKGQQQPEFGMDQFKGLFSDEERAEYGADLDKFEQPSEVYRSFREAQKMASRKSEIPKPLDQGGTEEEWKAFWTKLGTPDGDDGYELPQIEGMEVDDNYKANVSKIAHKHNLTKAQAEGLYSDWLELEKSAQADLYQQADAEWNQRIGRLADAWGDKKNEMDASVRNLIKHFGYEADTENIISPEAMLLLGDIAKQLDEKGQVGTIFNSTKAGIQTQIQEVEAEIVTIMNTNPDDPRMDSLQAKLQDLRMRSGDWQK
jgi:hypothetical protein